MLNDKQTSIKITIPYGMVLHATGIPQEYMLIFAYTDVDKVVKFVGELRDEAVRVRVNAEKFLKPVEQQGCQHPKERLKFTNEGVFCLDCNAPVLTPVVTRDEKSAYPAAIPLPNTPPPAAAPHLRAVQVQGQTIYVPDKAAPKAPVEEDKVTPEGEAEVKRAREESQAPLQRNIPQESSESKKD